MPELLGARTAVPRSGGYRHSASRTIAESFKRQVERRPDNIAVRHGDRRLTYAQLEAPEPPSRARLIASWR